MTRAETRMLALFTLNLSEARAHSKMLNVERKMQNSRETRRDLAQTRSNEGKKDVLGRPERERPGCGTRSEFNRLETSNHRGLCNLSNCSLCYFLLALDGPRDAFHARPQLFPPRFLAQFSMVYRRVRALVKCVSEDASPLLDATGENGVNASEIAVV